MVLVKKLVICTPTYNGEVSKSYLFSLMKLQRYLDSEKIEFVHFVEQSSLLHTTRNMMASLFVCIPHVTHVLFVDADIGFEVETAIKLLQSDFDVVGGVYPFKKIPMHYPAGSVAETDSVGDIIASKLGYAVRPPVACHNSDFYEFGNIGAGLLLISVVALRTMMAKNVVEKYKASNSPTWFSGRHYYGFFDYMTIGEEAVGEDYAFCERWKQTGGKIYGLICETITHTGSLTVTGRYADYHEISGNDQAEQ